MGLSPSKDGGKTNREAAKTDATSDGRRGHGGMWVPRIVDACWARDDLYLFIIIRYFLFRIPAGCVCVCVRACVGLTRRGRLLFAKVNSILIRFLFV